MGNTFPLSGGGVDAVEGVFGDGRAPAVRRSAAGRRSDERGLSRVRHFAQDRLQDLRPHMAAIRRRQERKRSSRCQDSPLEQRGFEPPVPLARVRVNFGEEKRPEVISVVSKDVVFFHGGTNGSNPFRSSAESGTNRRARTSNTQPRL